MRPASPARTSRSAFTKLELDALGAAARSATPVLPESLRNTGPSYLRWRREAIARGDAASLPGAA